MSFYGLRVHFFMELNKIFGLDNYSLSIKLLKDNFIAFKFWQFWVKLLKTSACRFCVDISFQNTDTNTEECDCWAVW